MTELGVYPPVRQGSAVQSPLVRVSPTASLLFLRLYVLMVNAPSTAQRSRALGLVISEFSHILTHDPAYEFLRITFGGNPLPLA
jgi:hypothetical protein